MPTTTPADMPPMKSSCLAALTAIVFAVLPAAAPAAVRWGVNPGMAQDQTLVGTAYAASAVQQMAAAGIAEARFAAPWYIADPDGAADRKGGSYVWNTYFDQVARLTAQNGIRWSPMFLYAPSVYSADPTGVSGGNPKRSAYGYFANFVKAFAQRYGTKGSFWRLNPKLPARPVTDYEIWNEPNIAGGWATPSTAPQDYMDLYAAAYPAVKSADPAARVMFASLTPSMGATNEVQFVTDALAHRPTQPIDEIGYHPDTIGIGTYGAADHVYALLRPFRAGLNALGLSNVPISVTELAWGSEYTQFPDSWVTLTENARADAMTAVGAALANSDCNVNDVQMLFWGTDRSVTDPSVDLARYYVTDFAIANPDNTLKPVGLAYRSVIATASTAAPSRICS